MTTNLPAIPMSGMPALAEAAPHLRTTDAVGAVIRYDEYSKLLPVATLQAVIAEIDGKMRPTEDKTLEMVRRLIGCYPNAKVRDIETYERAIRAVLAEVPSDIGWAAIDEITRTSAFLPARADVANACAALQGKRMDMRRAAVAQLNEHQRRSGRKPDVKLITDMPAEEREAFFADLRAKCPEGFAMVKRAAADRPKIEPNRRGLPTPPSALFREQPPADPGLEEDVA